jgi:RNA-directed DNA polymerase
VGATVPRCAEDAIWGCRPGGSQALAACEALSRGMGWVGNREKTRRTKRTDGVDVLGCQCIQRRRPPRGKWTLDIFPSKAAQRHVRRRMKCFTKRRAPMSPDAFVQRSNQTGRGGANDYRPTNAREAFRRWQRFINPRCRRDLPHRSKGRGFGGRQLPNQVLSAQGIIDIGSRYLRREKAPGHAW